MEIPQKNKDDYRHGSVVGAASLCHPTGCALAAPPLIDCNVIVADPGAQNQGDLVRRKRRRLHARVGPASEWFEVSEQIGKEAIYDLVSPLVGRTVVAHPASREGQADRRRASKPTGSTCLLWRSSCVPTSCPRFGFLPGTCATCARSSRIAAAW